MSLDFENSDLMKTMSPGALQCNVLCSPEPGTSKMSFVWLCVCCSLCTWYGEGVGPVRSDRCCPDAVLLSSLPPPPAQRRPGSPENSRKNLTPKRQVLHNSECFMPDNINCQRKLRSSLSHTCTTSRTIKSNLRPHHDAHPVIRKTDTYWHRSPVRRPLPPCQRGPGQDAVTPGATAHGSKGRTPFQCAEFATIQLRAITPIS